MESTPTNDELLTLAIESHLLDLHTALPGIVVAYDSTTQRADVRPAVKRALATTEGEPVTEALPVIPSVRVLWPRGAAFYMHFPLAVGDGVLLVFGEADPSAWSRTGQVAAPADLRRHALAHAVAIPGYSAARDAIDTPSTTAIELGTEAFRVRVDSSKMYVGGNVDAVALASKVDQLIAAFNTHTHVSAGAIGGAGVPVTGSSVSTMLKVGA